MRILSRLAYLALGLSIFTAPAMAQTASPAAPAPAAPAVTSSTTSLDRNVSQQDRIDQGLKSGELSTGEAAKLEKGEAHIDKMEAHDEKTGMTPAEQANLQKAQNAESAQIKADKSNGVTGNPASASSQRMQADVQRNASEQARIDNGVKSGSMTAKEAAKSEKGQASVSRTEARAGANGRVSKVEQAKIQGKETVQSTKIHNRRHNAATTAPAASAAPTPSPVSGAAPAAAQ